MIRINMIKFFLAIFTCKNTSDIIHNKRKFTQTNSEGETTDNKNLKKFCATIIDAFYNSETSSCSDSLFINNSDGSPLLLEKDISNPFFKELKKRDIEHADVDTNAVQGVCGEFFSVTLFDRTPTIAFSDEDQHPKIVNVESAVQNKNVTEKLSYIASLERLTTLYTTFFNKTCKKKKCDILNRCFVLFPETLVLLYIKIKNNENDESINNILEGIYELYKKNMVCYNHKISDVYLKRISFRKEMLNILRNELSNFSNHVLLYEKLAKLEELEFNIQISRKDVKFIYTKRITGMFNIIFLLEEAKVLLLMPKIDSLIKNINIIGHNHLITRLDLNELNIKSLFDKILFIKEIYDKTLPFLYSCSEKRKEFDEYFKNELREVQKKEVDCLIPIDIFKALNGLGIYKETFALCTFSNSACSFKTFFSKKCDDNA